MYKITLINGKEEILLHHYSNDPDAPKLINANGKFGFNGVPGVTLEIPITHETFNMFVPFKSHIKIEDNNNNEIFYGRMINPSDSINSGIINILIFEGELAYLNDSTIRPKEWHNYSVKDFLKEILEEHNSQVEDYKKIYIGNVTVKDNLYRMADYEKTLPLLLDRLPKRLGGFFNLRKVNGIKYLDYVSVIGKENNQSIEFGVNMLEYQTQCDTTGIFTKVVPLGADISEGEEESQVGNKVTIKEVNEGIDYLINEEAAAVYGLIEDVVKWDDVTLPSNLKRKGEEYLQEVSKPIRSLEMRVADISEINKEFDKYELGDEIEIKCDVFGVNERFKIVEMTIDFINPVNTTYVFGNKVGTLTDTQIMMQNSQAKLEGYFNDKGLITNYLDGTINMLSNNLRGMVNSADKHNGTAILFECRVPGDLYGAMAVGTRGFMISDELGDDGEWKWKTFGTAKGFVADHIIAGILSSVLIQNLDGSFQIDLSGKGGALFRNNEKDAIKIENNSIKLYNWAKDGDWIGSLLSLVRSNDNDKAMMGLVNDIDSALVLGYKSEDKSGEEFKSYIELDRYGILGHKNPITVMRTMGINGVLNFGKENQHAIYNSTADDLIIANSKNVIVVDKDTGERQLIISNDGVIIYGDLNVQGNINSNGVNSGGGSGTTTQTAVVASARKLIGKPYVYGGNYSPLGSSAGTDCSGLCQWAYNDNGITITRTTYTQINQGTEVEEANLKLGDLVFSNFSSPGVPEHVYMYSGKNSSGQHMCVEAPRTGLDIRERTFEWTSSMRARRIL